jgi:ubiquinone/menaquinone biosynthesis C-methylase UbiE
MPDAYARITELDDSVVAQLAAAMELRATDPAQRAFVDTYLADVPLRGADVLEIGCGTGAIARMLAVRPGVASVVGVDPSPVLLERARTLAADVPNLSFRGGTGDALPVADGSFDVAVLHTVLSHLPEPLPVLREAHRALRPGGTVAVFDGDYSTTTFALGPEDPLEACAAEFRRSYIHDAWVMRRATGLVQEAGFRDARAASHGYTQIRDAEYLLSVLGRGADSLAARGIVSADLAAALQREGRRRVEAGTFYGHIAYMSLVAAKG